jgi:hypothetical protein
MAVGFVAGCGSVGRESDQAAPHPLPVQAFAFQKEDRGVARPGGGMRLPVVSYDIRTPVGATPGKIEAYLAGAGGEKIPLTETYRTPAQRTFARVGYRVAPKSPRLVVLHDGKPVIEHAVQDLPAPIRAIPLVVPIDRKMHLRRATEAEARKLIRPDQPTEHFLISDPIPSLPAQEDRVVRRTEWGMQKGASRRIPVKGGIAFAFGLDQPDANGIAEMYTVHWQSVTEVRDVGVSVDVTETDGRVGFRLASPVTVEFPDRARILIPAVVRKADADSRSRVKRSLDFPIRTVVGGQLSPTEYFGGPDTLELRAGPPPPPSPEFGPPGAWVELLTPLDGLGIQRMRLGDVQFAGSPTPKAPVATGVQRVRLRFHYRFAIPRIDRSYVPILP